MLNLDPELEERINETLRARKAAVKMAREEASQGDPLAGMLSNLELLASPFFLGIDEDADDSDLDLWP